MSVRICILSITAFFILSGERVIGQGTGGPVLSSQPRKFRCEWDTGFAVAEFARFKFGDVYDNFPRIGGRFIEEVFNERPYSSSYCLGARVSYGLSRGIPHSEIYSRFGIYNVRHRSSFSENGLAPVVIVPYIDGIIRPLIGGATVGLFEDSDLQLHRKLFSYEIETGIRKRNHCGSLSLLPGLFFTYHKMQQRDSIRAFSFDPRTMTLLAHVNSNHYNIGGNLHFEIPLYKFLWLGTLSASAQYCDADYKGEQRFAGIFFITQQIQLALVADSKRRLGYAGSVETGLRLARFYGISLSVLGNVHFTNTMPYVQYPTPIVNTPAVTGPAKIKFHNQLTYGGDVNVSIIF